MTESVNDLRSMVERTIATSHFKEDNRVKSILQNSSENVLKTTLSKLLKMHEEVTPKGL